MCEGYADLVTFARITVDAAVMGGMPCIRGLRIPVATVVSMVADGMSTDEIVADLPYLEPEDIAEALRFAAEPCVNESCRCCPTQREFAPRGQPVSTSG
jgi:uncharacterized protein (DUF433 family)